MFYFFNKIIFSDASESWQLGFQDPATPVMEGIITFHNDLMFYLNHLNHFIVKLLDL